MVIHKITKITKLKFQKGLYQWSIHHLRPMPWKGEKDPYKIWLSEIILQQTRVEQGLAYYQNFVHTFPTVQHLSNASLQQVLKLWEGLGYYTRARNLHQSAQFISKSLNGNFPVTFEELIKLKGIGEYTAAAIASFAYDLPFAVLDGNVHRILSRYFGIAKTIQTSLDKKHFQSIADQLIDQTHPAKYNQAIMDFGAMCCTPKIPQCGICPLKKSCHSFKNNQIAQFPPAKIKLEKKTRFFHYYIIKKSADQVFIQQRKNDDIWLRLNEFPLIETDSNKPPSKLQLKNIFLEINKPYSLQPFLVQRQVLSHQIIHASFYFYPFPKTHLTYKSIPIKSLTRIAMPSIIAKKRKELVKLIASL